MMIGVLSLAIMLFLMSVGPYVVVPDNEGHQLASTSTDKMNSSSRLYSSKLFDDDSNLMCDKFGANPDSILISEHYELTGVISHTWYKSKMSRLKNAIYSYGLAEVDNFKYTFYNASGAHFLKVAPCMNTFDVSPDERYVYSMTDETPAKLIMFDIKTKTTIKVILVSNMK